MPVKKKNEKRIEEICRLIASGKVDEALRLAFALDAKSLFGLGVFFLGKRAFGVAEKVFDFVNRLNPKDAEAWSNKGVALGNLGRYEEAIQACDKVLELNPNYAEAWLNKGAVLGNLGRHEEAIQACDKVLELNPNLAEAWSNRGIVFFRRHAYDESLRDLRKARELFQRSDRENDASKVYGYELWSGGMQNWGKEEYSLASSSFRKAADAFHSCALEGQATSLKLLSQLVPLDEGLIAALASHSLPELKEQVRELSNRAVDLLKQFKIPEIHEEIRNLLLGKMACIFALANALEFQPISPKEFDEVRKTFREHGLLESVKAVNHLENFILDMQKYKTIKEISENEEARLLLALQPLKVLNGYLSQSISDSVPKEFVSATRPGSEEAKVKLKAIENTLNDWVRVCLVQLDFSLQFLAPPQEFGYVLGKDDEEIVCHKVFSALKTAEKEKANIICFPELSFASEWVEWIKKDFKDIIVIGGSYYQDRFNICPAIILGAEYLTRKIHPSPFTEGEVEPGRGMKRGKEILVFQTRFGRFVLLTCLDYREEVYRIIYNADEKIKNVDFIINPCYNRDVANFQKQGDLNCQQGSCPYILQANVLRINGEECGGTCIIGTDHKSALDRYEAEGYKPGNDPIKYKLLQAEREMMLIADLDVKRKGVPMPASGFKMKGVARYVFRDGRWQKPA